MCDAKFSSDGSVTLVAFIVGTVTNPSVDLLGKLTSGCICLDKALNDKGIRPPVNVLPSLSRLFRSAVPNDNSFPERGQMYTCYAIGQDVKRILSMLREKNLVEIYCGFTFPAKIFPDNVCKEIVSVYLNVIGIDSRLTDEDKLYMEFSDKFESTFINQEKPRRYAQNRELTWDLLRIFPRERLTKINSSILDIKYPKT